MTRRAVGLLLLAAVCRAQHVQFGSLVNGTPVANPAMDSQGNLIQLTINPITGICCGMGSRLALLVNRYGRDGSARILADTGLTPAEAPVFLAVDARDKAYVGANREGEPILLRIKPDGTREQRMLFVPFTRLAAMAFASDGDPVIVGSDFGPTIQVVRLDADTLAPVAAKLLNRGVGVPRAIAVDTAGNVYITGVSTGFEFDATPGALQPVGSGVFVTKLSPDLQSVVYSTHITDKGVSGGMAIQAASDGTVYVAGYVLGGAGEGAFPTTPGAFQRQLDREPRLWLTNGGLPLVVGPSTGFVLRLNSEGSALIASTLLGGSLSESIDGLALDEQGRVIVHGSAQSRDFPATGVFSTPCGPDRGRAFRAWFLTRLDPMLERVERSILVSGVVSRGLPSGSLRGSVFLILSGSRALADLDRDEPSDVACVTSGASYEGLSALTPGQLVTVIGRGLGPAQLAAFEDGKPLPDTVDGAEVLFN
ncbi:MAG: SBBP repeat-containing protein, partial [Bryobacteraceae bacterium]